MEKEFLMKEAASLVYEDWRKQELEAFYNRAKKIFMDGEKNVAKALRKACYKGDTKRNEIFIDIPFMLSHEMLAIHCLDSFESFMNLFELGIIEVKRFVSRTLTEEEINEKLSKDDYKEETQEENILLDFKYLSYDSQKENLEAAKSAYSVFEELSKAGITIEEMSSNLEIRNLIGIGIHTDWMKRNVNHPNDSLKVPYSELDDWTKQQDLTVFDALLKVIKSNNITIEQSLNSVVPDYSQEEVKVLEKIKLQKQTNEDVIKTQKTEEILGLYVANQIVDDFQLIEPWVQYDTDGRVLHRIVVFPKRVLLYSKIDETGKMSFYKVDTDKKVKIVNYEPLCSYESDASCGYNLAAMGKAGYSTGVASINKSIRNELEAGYNEYGLVVPFEEFYEQKFGKKLENYSLISAKVLLSLSNLFVGKPIVLSIDPQIASQQLEKIGCINDKNKIKSK